MVTDKDVPITMRDGIILSANVYRPDKPGRYPVLITQMPYNKEAPLASANTYLVDRGYVHIVVDVRGTGGSEGSWDSFGPREERDGPRGAAWGGHPPRDRCQAGRGGAPHQAATDRATAGQHPGRPRAGSPS